MVADYRSGMLRYCVCNVLQIQRLLGENGARNGKGSAIVIYEFFRLLGVTLGYPLQWLFFKRKTYYENGKKTSLKKGGKLLVINHYNMLDYVMNCFTVYPRKLYAVASEMPFRSKLARFGMKFFGAIEANRETRNMKFIKDGAEVIKQGYLLYITPEGHNTPDGNMQPFHPSYVLIAHRANAPIVLIISDGNYGFFKRVRVMISEEINVSDFIDPNKKTPTKAEILAFNEYVQNKALKLREEIEIRKAQEKQKRKKRGGEKQ